MTTYIDPDGNPTTSNVWTLDQYNVRSDLSVLVDGLNTTTPLHGTGRVTGNGPRHGMPTSGGKVTNSESSR